jgi:hypothetical protein
MPMPLSVTVVSSTPLPAPVAGTASPMATTIKIVSPALTMKAPEKLAVVPPLLPRSAATSDITCALAAEEKAIDATIMLLQNHLFIYKLGISVGFKMTLAAMAANYGS